MTRPEQSGEDPHQTGAGADGPLVGGSRSAYPPAPAERPWDWAIDAEPPEGPSQQPVPDPAADQQPVPSSGRGRTVDEIPDPIPPGVGAPPRSTGGAPAPSGAAPSGAAPSGAVPASATPSGAVPGGAVPGGPTGQAPDWSTPDTPTDTPPLGGYPGPQQWPGQPAVQTQGAPRPGPPASGPTG
ncbi:hypothetical protein I0C86_38670, partial [Plantactinospora sp. S1510]|nr:hypothetical protein [Plantactinospora alkalitolerans]